MWFSKNLINFITLEELDMKQENINYANFENLTNSERVARVVVSIAAIVVAMESSIAGTTLFAVISVMGIALSLSGIVGWDPVRALSSKKVEEKVHTNSHHGHTA